jgi:hypothetical protein
MAGKHCLKIAWPLQSSGHAQGDPVLVRQHAFASRRPFQRQLMKPSPLSWRRLRAWGEIGADCMDSARRALYSPVDASILNCASAAIGSLLTS